MRFERSLNALIGQNFSFVQDKAAPLSADITTNCAYISLSGEPTNFATVSEVKVPLFLKLRCKIKPVYAPCHLKGTYTHDEHAFSPCALWPHKQPLMTSLQLIYHDYGAALYSGACINVRARSITDGQSKLENEGTPSNDWTAFQGLRVHKGCNISVPASKILHTWAFSRLGENVRIHSKTRDAHQEFTFEGGNCDNDDKKDPQAHFQKDLPQSACYARPFFQHGALYTPGDALKDVEQCYVSLSRQGDQSIAWSATPQLMGVPIDTGEVCVSPRFGIVYCPYPPSKDFKGIMEDVRMGALDVCIDQGATHRHRYQSVDAFQQMHSSFVDIIYKRVNE